MKKIFFKKTITVFLLCLIFITSNARTFTFIGKNNEVLAKVQEETIVKDHPIVWVGIGAIILCCFWFEYNEKNERNYGWKCDCGFLRTNNPESNEFLQKFEKQFYELTKHNSSEVEELIISN
jgi:hypothetical protein